MKNLLSLLTALTMMLTGCGTSLSPAQQAIQNAGNISPAQQAVIDANQQSQTQPTQDVGNNDDAEPTKPSGELLSELSVFYIDAGQADSIMITSGGESMIIDAGNNADGDDVVSFLKSKGVSNLKYAVGTHPHEDHIGGLDDVLNSFPVEKVLLPDVTTNTKTFASVLDAIENNNLSLSVPTAGEQYKVGSATLTVVSCLKTTDLNNSSIVLRMDHGENSFLFTGDAESEAEQAILSAGYDVNCDVLKAGHHGSKTSTSSAFLTAVSPDVAIISCGVDNSYGHPSPETIQKLSGIEVYRTDLNGTITVVSDGSKYTITKEK